MAKVFIKQGNAAIGVSDELERMVNNLLDQLPLIRQIFENEMTEIYEEAYRQWPVRTQRPRTADEKKAAIFGALKRQKGTQEASAIMREIDESGRIKDDPIPVRVSPKSQDSKNRLQKGILIEGEDIVAFVRNDAPYAWAITTGEYTLNDLAFGTRTADELLWKPTKRAASKLVNVIADDLMRGGKKK